MNLQKLFDAQKKLDDHIRKEKGLEGQDLLDKKILALQVELGELANNWRGFKFWSENQKARTTGKERCFACEGAGRFIYPSEFVDGHTYAEGCAECQGTGWIPTDKNPLLEEYVDCLHFILSIGLDLGFEKQTAHSFKNGNSILGQFQSIYNELSSLYYHRQMYNYQRTLNLIIGLGELLGFTWQEVEQAYFDKNQINHERQESGY